MTIVDEDGEGDVLYWKAQAENWKETATALAAALELKDFEINRLQSVLAAYEGN